MASILKNKGTSGTDAQVFTGRALSFDSASSQSIEVSLPVISTNTYTYLFNCKPDELSATNKITFRPSGFYLWVRLGTDGINCYYYNGTNVYTNVATLTIDTNISIMVEVSTTGYKVYVNKTEVLNIPDSIFFSSGYELSLGGKDGSSYWSGQLSNVVAIDGILTPQQISDYHATPHTFLYKTESGLASDSGLDTSKVVSWFPMTEDDGYVRDVANYSEVDLSNSMNSNFDNGSTNWILASGHTIINSKLNIVRSGTNNVTYMSANKPEIGKTYIVEPNIEYVVGSSNLETRFGGGIFYINNNTPFIHTATSSSWDVRSGYVSGEELNIEFTVYEVSSIYPITNYTTDMPFKGLNYGLQTAKLLLDDNGVVVGKSDFAEFYGELTPAFTQIVPEPITGKVTITANLSSSNGTVSSGGLTVYASQFTLNQNSTIVLENQTISGDIDFGVGAIGTIKEFKVEL